MQYKHVAPKTTWELWWLANITSHVEKALPNYWTANTVTVLGNLALPIAGMITLYHAGPKYHVDGKDDTPLPSWIFFMSAFAVQYFSWGDGMDGQRARRLKCGTPIGRIMDEAGDPFQYTWIAILLGHVFRFAPGFSASLILFINIP